MPMEAHLDAKLATVISKPDPEPHIVIQTELCLVCEERPCTIVCPADLYWWGGGQMVHNCEGCLECGSCRAVCPHGAITWRYPRGEYGVRYRWG
jgi:ferredoxin like protein